MKKIFLILIAATTLSLLTSCFSKEQKIYNRLTDVYKTPICIENTKYVECYRWENVPEQNFFKNSDNIEDYIEYTLDVLKSPSKMYYDENHIHNEYYVWNTTKYNIALSYEYISNSVNIQLYIKHKNKN